MPGMRSIPLKQLLKLLEMLPAKYAALAALGATTGCRISELLVLQRHDLLNREGKLKEEISFIKLKTKSDKIVHRKLSIPPDFHTFIYRHLVNEEQSGHDMPTDWVFRGKCGKPLTRQTAYKKFYSFLGSGYGTHWMRKTFAGELFRYLLRENPQDPMRALELCRKALDHARIDTTVKYLGIQEEKITSAQNSIFNIERIKKHGA